MKKTLLLAMLLMGSQAYASQHFQPDPIYAADKQAGSVTYHDKAQYMVSYRVSLSNPLKTPASIAKGSFILFDRSGKEVVARGVDVNLLQEFAPGESKTGMVFFFSDNENIYGLPFVKWVSSNTTDSADNIESVKNVNNAESEKKPRITSDADNVNNPKVDSDVNVK
jgi:hypothetical protein